VGGLRAMAVSQRCRRRASFLAGRRWRVPCKLGVIRHHRHQPIIIDLHRQPWKVVDQMTTRIKGKGKTSSLDIAPLTILNSGTFTTLEVAADWQ